MSKTAEDLSRSRVEAPLRMTWDEFLRCEGERFEWAEWVDGEVVFLSAASWRHGTIASYLDRLMGSFVDERALGGVCIAPYLMKTGPNLPGREPDLIFIATENMHRTRTNYLEGPADIAVEVVSLDSQTRDRVDKLREYEQGGVREYWLIDPLRSEAVFYGLGSDGRYLVLPIEEDGVFRSRVLDGFWFNVDWLWREKRPTTASVIAMWKRG